MSPDPGDSREFMSGALRIIYLLCNNYQTFRVFPGALLKQLHPVLLYLKFLTDSKSGLFFQIKSRLSKTGPLKPKAVFKSCAH